MMQQVKEVIRTQLGMNDTGSLTVQVIPSGQVISEPLYEYIAPKAKLCVTIDLRQSRFVETNADHLLAACENIHTRLLMLERSDARDTCHGSKKGERGCTRS